MKVLIFGGSGFLGSHIADVLTDNDYDVTIFDLNKSKHLRDTQKMIVGDILDNDQVQHAIEGMDYVYNFAGFADLDDSIYKPRETLELNIKGNLNILDALLNKNIKRFIYASTIYVYSNKGGFYRCSKQASELYIEEYNRVYGLDYTILRYGSLYGTRSNETNGIYKYIMQALQNKKIISSGSGEEIREYINVKDAARLSMEILSEKYNNSHVIITGHHPMKASDMLMMIKEIIGENIDIIFKENNMAHYYYTPYSFTPKIGNKLVSNEYLDMGQGLLEVMQEIFKELNNSHNNL